MIIGMDFGTTNSGIAQFDGKHLRMIPLDPSSANPHVARSALYITNDRGVHIGRDAIDTYYAQNLNRPTKLEYVRVGEIELTFADLSFIRDVYVERDVFAPGRLFLSFKMGLPSAHYLGTIVGSHYYFLEDIIATYLYVTRTRAELELNQPVDSIVLGRPVRYSEKEEENTLAQERLLQAAFRAGYKTVYLQYEPIAAAYYYETQIDGEQNVLIFDFGGGTLDISVLRVGNPRTRRVLANGGIAIAGDVFDQKITRAKFPPHFGEGGHYRDARQTLPVPSSYYEAFANWQDLLSLQRPERLDAIRRMERTASEPLKIRALLALITSNYALKMFDLAEASKRQVSDQPGTLMKFDGPGFIVRERLTRAEFEKLIRGDVRAIAARLDEVLADAGLKPEQIDAVIRTGGSSLIPAFIDLLQARFGADKVRAVDAFSSVTAGLGILAHEIETGQSALKAYHAAEMTGSARLNASDQGGVPVVDFDLIKKLIQVREGESAQGAGAHVLLVSTSAGELIAGALNAAKSTHYADTAAADVFLPDDYALLLTTEYRVFRRPVRDLADLYANGLKLAEIEGFQSDAFGKETVCALGHWSALADAEDALLLTTNGYAQRFTGSQFSARLAQAVPYQLPRRRSAQGTRGYPAALLGLTGAREVLVIGGAGRAARLLVSDLELGEQRALRLSGDGRVIGAFTLGAEQTRSAEVLIASSSGYAKRVPVGALSLSGVNTSGDKIALRGAPVAARLYRADAPLYGLTSTRLVPLDSSMPLSTPDEGDSYPLLKLKRGETLRAVFYAGR